MKFSKYSNPLLQISGRAGSARERNGFGPFDDFAETAAESLKRESRMLEQLASVIRED
jgi:hypothetical protein